MEMTTDIETKAAGLAARDDYLGVTLEECKMYCEKEEQRGLLDSQMERWKSAAYDRLAFREDVAEAQPGPPPGYVPVTAAMAATGQSHSWVDYHGRKGHFSMIRDESTPANRGGFAWVVELAGVMAYYRKYVLGETDVSIPAHYVIVKVVVEKYGIPNPWLCEKAKAGLIPAIKKPRARGKWPWMIDEAEAVAYRIKKLGKGSLRMPECVDV